jgi:tRNA (guanine9-N1)-methyltransferase
MESTTENNSNEKPDGNANNNQEKPADGAANSQAATTSKSTGGENEGISNHGKNPDNTEEKDGDNNNKEGEVKKVSKNQLKRQRKWEQAMEVKRRRKEQEKGVKLAVAKAEGRDIDAERREMEEGYKNGVGRAKRNEKWKDRFEQNASKYQVCVDCSFANVMVQKEVNSLANQIRYCYAANKKAKHPVTTKVTSLGGETLDNLKNVSGFETWSTRNFNHTDQGLLESYPDKSKLVYLTSDSETVLDTLEDDKVYIIGGIVDRNRLTRAAIDRAEELGIATAKFPISENLSMVATKVLTCNHVFEILVKYRDHGNDWKKTLLDVLPIRKDAT